MKVSQLFCFFEVLVYLNSHEAHAAPICLSAEMRVFSNPEVLDTPNVNKTSLSARQRQILTVDAAKETTSKPDGVIRSSAKTEGVTGGS